MTNTELRRVFRNPNPLATDRTSILAVTNRLIFFSFQ